MDSYLCFWLVRYRFKSDKHGEVPYFMFGDFNFRLDQHLLAKVKYIIMDNVGYFSGYHPLVNVRFDFIETLHHKEKQCCGSELGHL